MIEYEHRVPPENVLFIDTETFSTQELSDVGTYKYTEDFELLLVGFKLGDKYAVWDFQEGKPFPIWAIQHIENGGKVAAFNAMFDYLVLTKHNTTIPFQITQLIDIMAMCGACGLPISLDKAGKALSLPQDSRKLREGSRLVTKFCKPRKPTKHNKSTRVMPEDAEEDWEKFKHDYLRLDVVACYEIYRRLPDLSESEQSVWVDTQTVNQIGMPIDSSTCKLIIDKLDKLVDEESSKFIRLTSLFPTQRDKVLAWVRDKGVHAPNMQAATVQEIINNDSTPEIVKEALIIRANTTHASFKKFPKMMMALCEDDRVRGTLAYHIAGTGRFGGRLVQPQNLTRGSIDSNEAVQRIHDGEFTVELVKSAVRGMIHSIQGFCIADYKGIEARVVQWVCQDLEALQVFFDGKDPYVWMAQRIYGVGYDEVTSAQRFTGKQAILGLGYQMSAKKFIAMVESYGETISVDEANLAVKVYRETHKKLARFWATMNKCAIMALERPGKFVKVNKHVSYLFDGLFLYMRLPSGRYLHYYLPQIEQSSWGDNTFTYMSMNDKHQYVRTHTYGGKLTENLVQAIARDLLVGAVSDLLSLGYKIITHIHDEIVIEGGDLEHIMEVMCKLPNWAEGLPLEAEGFKSPRFKKG